MQRGFKVDNTGLFDRPPCFRVLFYKIYAFDNHLLLPGIGKTHFPLFAFILPRYNQHVIVFMYVHNISAFIRPPAPAKLFWCIASLSTLWLSDRKYVCL